MTALPIPPPVSPALSPTGGAPLNPVTPTGSADAFENALRQLGGASSPTSALTERVASGLQSFRTRAEGIGREMSQAMTQPAAVTAPAAPPVPGSGAAGPVQVPGAPGDAGGVQGMYRMVVRTFDFAMETHLVAKAATQFTGSINTLMKGQ